MTKRKKIAIISAITIALITLIIIILIVAFKKDDDGKGTAYVTSYPNAIPRLPFQYPVIVLPELLRRREPRKLKLILKKQ